MKKIIMLLTSFLIITLNAMEGNKCPSSFYCNFLTRTANQNIKNNRSSLIISHCVSECPLSNDCKIIAKYLFLVNTIHFMASYNDMLKKRIQEIESIADEIEPSCDKSIRNILQRIDNLIDGKNMLEGTNREKNENYFQNKQNELILRKLNNEKKELQKKIQPDRAFRFKDFPNIPVNFFTHISDEKAICEFDEAVNRLLAKIPKKKQLQALDDLQKDFIYARENQYKDFIEANKHRNTIYTFEEEIDKLILEMPKDVREFLDKSRRQAIRDVAAVRNRLLFPKSTEE